MCYGNCLPLALLVFASKLPPPGLIKSLLRLAQQSLLSLVQQALPNWHNMYKFATQTTGINSNLSITPGVLLLSCTPFALVECCGFSLWDRFEVCSTLVAGFYGYQHLLPFVYSGQLVQFNETQHVPLSVASLAGGTVVISLGLVGFVLKPPKLSFEVTTF